ncbi:MAG: glycosyltransferase family 2 protein [Flavisolibacter sp.]
MLSIIIVNYRSSDLILPCISSVKKFNPDLQHEFIVVDNASGDDSETRIRQGFPDVQWVSMGFNSGFARANNAGMRKASGSCFLLLNPDTLATDNSIYRCYQRLSQSDYVGSGVQLLDPQGQPQISGNFFVKGGLNLLLPLPYWGSFIRWLGYRSGSKVPNIQKAKALEEVDWITGAFLMVRKSVTEKAGLMDEDFFLYAEEVEWCSRLRKQGRLCLYGDLQIIHLEGGSINKEQNAASKGYYNLFDKKGLQLMVSNHLRVRKQYGVFWFLFLLLNYTWGLLLFWILSTFHRLLTLRNPFGDWKKVGAFAKNLLKLWMLSPRIVAGRPFFYKMF